MLQPAHWSRGSIKATRTPMVWDALDDSRARWTVAVTPPTRRRVAAQAPCRPGKGHGSHCTGREIRVSSLPAAAILRPQLPPSSRPTKPLILVKRILETTRFGPVGFPVSLAPACARSTPPRASQRPWRGAQPNANANDDDDDCT